MKLAVMQPYFFPYIGYFQLISEVDTFILYDNVNYIVKGWVNRNRIILCNKSVAYFGIENTNASSNRLISEISISYNAAIKKRLIKTLELNYKKSPFYEETMPVIKSALNIETTSLSKLNIHSMQIIIQHLDIKTMILTDCSQFQNIEAKLEDLYNGDNKGKEIVPDKKSMRIILLCKQLNSSHYINPIGGTDIYKKDVLSAYGININFINTLPYSYPQNITGFYPHLSIIDVLMNCGKEQTKHLLKNYTLV